MRSCRFLSVLLYLLYRRFLCRKKENVDKIQEIFTAPWAIADNDYYRLLSLLVPCVAAGNLDAIEKRLDNNKITAYATTPYLANRWELDDDTLPADSVAVIILKAPCIPGRLTAWKSSSVIFPIILRFAARSCGSTVQAVWSHMWTWRLK